MNRAPSSLSILYDYLMVPGGAERLTLEMCEALPEADLRVAGIYPDCTGLMLPHRVVDLGLRARHPALRAVGAVRAFEHHAPRLEAVGRAVFSGMYAPLAVGDRDQGNLCYCHTPPRFVYDLAEFYLNQAGWAGRWALQTLTAWYRPRYERAMGRMNRIVVNSENVRRRLHHYLGLPATVIYPPVAVEQRPWLAQAPYYLSLARLEDFKRVEVIIDAFLGLPQHELVVASGGSQLARLRRRAGDAPNIRFVGWLTDQALARWIGECTATLYLPKDEDFGMSPVESMAAGKPVIGVAEGGLLETVLPGETGLLLPPDPTPEQVREAVLQLGPDRALSMRKACEARAQDFRRERFQAQIREMVLAG